MSRSGRQRNPWVSLGVGLATACVVLLLTQFKVFDSFENTVWDLRVSSMARPSAATSQIEVVLVDQSSLDWVDKELGQNWPWPREYYGLIARFLGQAGAKAVVFDVIFDQDSTTGGDDQAFAQGLKDARTAILAQSLVAEPKGLVRHPPIAMLANSAAGLGHVRAIPDADGTIRKVAPIQTLPDGTRLPSLAVAAWLLGTGKTVDQVADSETLLRYRGGQKTHRTWSAAEILRSAIQLSEGEKPQVDPALFRDHYVFFGFSAQGLFDLRPSPVDNKYPGVYVHATHLDNLLAGDTLRTPAWYWLLLLVVIWSVLSAWGVGRLKRAWVTAPLFLAAVGLPVAAGWIAYAAGWWWPIVPPVVGALVAGLAMLLINYAVEGRNRRFIQNAFGQYLSPAVISRLVEDPDQLKLGGEKRCLSIFFSDVAGFTSISENLDPVGLTSLLNDYLSEMTSIIYAYGGTIDKYEGDAIIAFWNAPLDLPDHAAQAVRACLACQTRLEEIQPRLSKQAGRPVLARIGLNTGDVVIGNMGSSQRFNYTFLGDAGNLASRLEGINKLFGTRFLVSEFTKALAAEASDLHWREISRVRVVGKNKPVTVFEPLFRVDAERQRDLLDQFDRALQAYYRGDFGEALSGFEANSERDAASRHYAMRVKELMSSPPSLWEGVWDAKEK